MSSRKQPIAQTATMGGWDSGPTYDEARGPRSPHNVSGSYPVVLEGGWPDHLPRSFPCITREATDEELERMRSRADQDRG